VLRVLLASILLGITFSPAASPAGQGRFVRAAGLTVVAPRGWHLTHEKLTECTSPTQVLALTDAKMRLGVHAKLPRARTLLLFLEDRSYAGTRFPPRKRFRTAPLRVMGGCCELPLGTGFEIAFRERGRNFYAFVYASTRVNAARAVEVVNSLVVRAERPREPRPVRARFRD
jgi:hypothetical protein